MRISTATGYRQASRCLTAFANNFDIEHGLIPPRHSQPNGMVERFNCRISEIVQKARFASAAELESTLRSYLKIYNTASRNAP